MPNGTITLPDLAREQEFFIKSFGRGLQLIEGGIREVFQNTRDEYDEYVDLENESPEQEPDPSWPNER